MDKQIVTRKEAREKGLKKYFTGSICVNGHIAERLTISGSCFECCKENTRKMRLKIKENAND